MGCEGCEWEKPPTQALDERRALHESGAREILSDLEADLTRLDSSDEEPLARPMLGRNVVRRVSMYSSVRAGSFK